MARQEINIGAAANDGTGDSLRNAFDKTNQNTQELYHNTRDTKTDNHTLVLGDEQKMIVANKATAISFTVPPNSDVAFPTGTRTRFKRINTGVLTFVQGSGVTITGSSGALTDAGANVVMTLEKTGTNTWDLDNGSADELTDYVPTQTGISGSPTITAAKYILRGKLCTVHLVITGTSNTTAMTITLPFAAANTAVQSFAVIAIDNTTTQADPGKLNTRVNSNIADVYKTLPSGTWTSSGAKGLTGVFTYIIA